MRSTPDRIRHAVSFEIVGLALATPLAAWAFEKPLHHIGVVTFVSATIATLWNYAYNLGFDHVMLRVTGRVGKTPAVRVAHALLFEAGLLVILLPFIAWYLGVGLGQVLAMDLSFAAFYVVYAFGFNWAYDVVFPVPGARPDGGSG